MFHIIFTVKWISALQYHAHPEVFEALYTIFDGSYKNPYEYPWALSLVVLVIKIFNL